MKSYALKGKFHLFIHFTDHAIYNAQCKRMKPICERCTTPLSFLLHKWNCPQST